MNGGTHVAEVLVRHGVRHLFTLCGGHISPILVEAKRLGVRVVDVRQEATAAFAADAMARLSGVPGVAAVTAGPGLTNTLTALQNARMAESPLVLLGGATATLLKGRGALQDIDQLSLVRPLVKQAWAVRRVKDLAPAVEEAFRVAQEGIPGPVFVECPVDLLYPEELVSGWYGGKGTGKSFGERALNRYLRWHARRLFAGADRVRQAPAVAPWVPTAEPGQVATAARWLRRAHRPLLIVGSGALLEPREADRVAAAVEALDVPVYLTGAARGLLGRRHPLQLRHARGEALRRCDFLLLAGFPVDFRLDYGRKINRAARLVAVGRDRELLLKNRRPDLAVEADAGRFLCALAARRPAAALDPTWRGQLSAREAARDAEIDAQAAEEVLPINPLAVVRAVEEHAAEEAVLVADGGDFVATASYVVRPRGPLAWLDPGPFGTLGVGAGFALAAKLHRPECEVWLLWGDGAAGYGLVELDTFARHQLPVIAVVGNDAAWMQIARDQVDILGDDVGTVLARNDYHQVAAGLGAVGRLVSAPGELAAALVGAKEDARAGRPVLLNVHLGRSEFRKGSLSM